MVAESFKRVFIQPERVRGVFRQKSLTTCCWRWWHCSVF